MIQECHSWIICLSQSEHNCYCLRFIFTYQSLLNAFDIGLITIYIVTSSSSLIKHKASFVYSS